ncbi:MAG: 50S ribosomal protein L11 [Candidatus Methanomethylicota archaeon]|uniref:Large ribosomal subunit protein uL11 n=1 Tax=Thermoproteota archaeon TaxID=2056631 RepID=A0A497EYH8_9CREN|nr:MAG: 50S ribosomal protein L11 [Candidatus Verstraetearchaeota archaeon]RLE55914.1 MAG: 50S ribosomal protein L11 [Candidatus Verstraetearchaeota archaeon]
MGTKKTFNFLVEGGKATGGPPIGPALGPLGVNIMQVVNKINELTKEFSGMRVPVTVTVDIDTKEFEVSVGVPTTTALIIRELKVEKGSGTPHEKKIGNLSIEQVVKIAQIKRKQLLAKTLKGAVKEVLGTCLSMGVTVEGKDPRDVQKEIDAGKYDEIISKYEEGEG